MSDQPSAEETVNALLVEIRLLENTYNEMTARQNLLERALIEGRAALESIKELKGRDPGEVITQIGGGAMLRSKPPSTETVLISIGSNLVIEKPREEAIAMLEERSREIEKTIVSLAGQRKEIGDRLNSDREILNNLVTRSQQG